RPTTPPCSTFLSAWRTPSTSCRRGCTRQAECRPQPSNPRPRTFVSRDYRDTSRARTLVSRDYREVFSPLTPTLSPDREREPGPAPRPSLVKGGGRFGRGSGRLR